MPGDPERLPREPLLPLNPDRTPTAVRSCSGTPSFFVQVALQLGEKPVVKDQSDAVADALRDFPDEQVVDGSVKDNYVLVFNRYNVAKRHYLLVAHRFRHQLEVLGDGAFRRVCAILGQYPTLTAVYNGGRLSGSSQPRQHVQILQLEGDTPLDVLIQQQSAGVDGVGGILRLREFSGKLHGVCLFANEYDEAAGRVEFSADGLAGAYSRLLEACRVRRVAIQRDKIPHTYPKVVDVAGLDLGISDPEQRTEIAVQSYSLYVTRDYMFMAQRVAEDGFNAISFSGYAFTADPARARLIEERGLYEMLRDTLADE